ncbi:hypothetical protein M885DRAFT_590204, partial [Pelagophyceae sp. CCMP2097]
RLHGPRELHGGVHAGHPGHLFAAAGPLRPGRPYAVAGGHLDALEGAPGVQRRQAVPHPGAPQLPRQPLLPRHVAPDVAGALEAYRGARLRPHVDADVQGQHESHPACLHGHQGRLEPLDPARGRAVGRPLRRPRHRLPQRGPLAVLDALHDVHRPGRDEEQRVPARPGPHLHHLGVQGHHYRRSQFRRLHVISATLRRHPHPRRLGPRRTYSREEPPATTPS